MRNVGGIAVLVGVALACAGCGAASGGGAGSAADGAGAGTVATATGAGTATTATGAAATARPVPAGPPTRREMAGRELVSTSVVGHAMDPGSRVALSFLPGRGGEISFSGGCNRMGGAAELRGGVLRFTDPRMFSTLMRCFPPARERQDRWVAALMTGGVRLMRTATGYVLTRGATRIALVPQPSRLLHPSRDARTWVLRSYGRLGGPDTPVPAGAPPVKLAFSPDGSAALEAPCGDVRAQVLYGVDRIGFGHVTAGRRACPDGRTAAERAARSVLHAPEVAYRWAGPDLVLTHGPVRLTFGPRR